MCASHGEQSKVGGEVTSALSATVELPLIPLGGVTAGPISVGPVVRILGQASVDAVSAEATLTLGTRLDVPADSVVRLNFNDGNDNKIGGWVPSFTPVGPELSGSVSVSASVGTRIQLELSLSFLGLGAYVGVALGAPTLGLTLGADANTVGGVCNNPDAQLEVNIDVGLSAELDAFDGVGDLRDLPNRVGLVSISTGLFATCLTIAGSAPTASGRVTDFTFSDSEDCSFERAEGSSVVAGECQQFGFLTFFHYMVSDRAIHMQ
jgi:hypothetical protein